LFSLTPAAAQTRNTSAIGNQTAWSAAFMPLQRANEEKRCNEFKHPATTDGEAV
jgi:hypothetical protein